MTSNSKCSSVILGVSYAVSLSPLFFVGVFIGPRHKIGIILLVAYLLLAIGQIILAFNYSAGQTNWRLYAARALMFLIISVKAESLGLHSIAVFGLFCSTIFTAYAMFYDRWLASVSILKNRLKSKPVRWPRSD
jgi:hypothetical protein